MTRRKTPPVVTRRERTYYGPATVSNVESGPAEPAAGNGSVAYRIHRVTVEIVDEPNDVLMARLWNMRSAMSDSRKIKLIDAEIDRLIAIGKDGAT